LTVSVFVQRLYPAKPASSVNILLKPLHYFGAGLSVNQSWKANLYRQIKK